MLWRVVGGFVPMICGWLVFSGAIPVGNLIGGSGEYRKEVARPVAVVAHAISDVAVDPMAGSGAAHLSSLPPIRRQKNEDGYSWFLMNGPDVVAELKATLTSTSNGEGTIVRTSVKPGSMRGLGPNYANKQALGMLFANAVEAELDVFASAAERKANAKNRQSKHVNMQAAQVMANPFAAGLQAQKEYMRTKKELSEMEDDMNALDAASARDAYNRSSNVTFRPGQPMVDVGR